MWEFVSMGWNEPCVKCQQAWNYLVLVSLVSSKVQLLTYRHKPPLFPNAKKQQELSLVLAACVFGALCLPPCAFTWHAWCCTERPLWLFDTALRPVYSHALWTGCSILHNWSLMCTSSHVDLIHHFLDFQTLGGRRVKNERLKSRTQASLKGGFFFHLNTNDFQTSAKSHVHVLMTQFQLFVDSLRARSAKSGVQIVIGYPEIR